MKYPLALDDISLFMYQRIPMRDGVNLAANIFRPHVTNEPLAAIMVLTPYSSDFNVERGTYFAQYGYVFVSVECRGRGNSEGLFVPFVNEGEDGHDAVEWIASQPWCNGRIGLMGGSYKGMVQWLIAKERPPHLVSIAPTATVCPGIDATRDRNIYRTFNLQILSLVSGRTMNGNLPFSEYIQARIRRYYETGTAYAALLIGEIEGAEHPLREVFEEWLAHPTFDDYWKDILPTAEDYAHMDLPVLSITGYFDDDQPGHLHYYREFLRFATPEARAKLFLMIGPWDHGGTRRPVPIKGGLEFRETGVVDMLSWHQQWFDWTLKEGPRPEFLADNVNHYQLATGKWLACRSLDDAATQSMIFYLSPDRFNPTDLFQSGKLQNEPATKGTVHTLRYDPLQKADKDPYVIANDWGSYLTSQDYLAEPGWLYYHSPALEQDIDIIGHITLKAYFEIDTPDTDFTYKLYELTAAGDHNYLAHGLMRARFRTSHEQQELITPGSVNLYEIQSLYVLSRRISKGSRLRLLIGYLDSSAYQKNYNSGGDVSFETADDAQICTIRLHISETFPSSLALPLLDT